MQNSTPHQAQQAPQPVMKRHRPDDEETPPDHGNAEVQMVMKVPSSGGKARYYSVNMPPKFCAALQVLVTKQQALPRSDKRADVETAPVPEKVSVSRMQRTISATDLLSQTVTVKEQHMQPQHTHRKARASSNTARMRSLPLTGAEASTFMLPSTLQACQPIGAPKLPSLSDNLARLAAVAEEEACKMTDNSAAGVPSAQFVARNPLELATILI
jgi:hypothetical protein